MPCKIFPFARWTRPAALFLFIAPELTRVIFRTGMLVALSTIFSLLPGGFGSSLAGLITFVASIWSLLLYIKTTAVAQGLSQGKAFLAIVLE